MKKKAFLIKHMIAETYLGSILAVGLFFIVTGDISHWWSDLLFSMFLAGLFVVHPVVLTLLNLFFLLRKPQTDALQRKGRHLEWLTIMEGSLFTMFFVPLSGVTFYDWSKELSNAAIHTPIWTEGAPTVALLAGLGAAGYLFLSIRNVNHTPPLLSVTAMAALYLGMAMCVLWMVQVFGMYMTAVFFCLFPFNCLLLGAKLIRWKVAEWQGGGPGEGREFDNPGLAWMNRKLARSQNWPLAAFLLMWPLLLAAIGVLVLFGQRADAVIRAWTETSDWNLSTKIAPPNVIYDEHYLCTVAAGGHRKLVKPLRMGVRHGHRVVVNRQLCIANAFEQILEERLPVFHRHLRHFYDTFGFPIARGIRTPLAADAVYLLMKPLEWLFLLVIYGTDAQPENRIAVQYLPAKERLATKKENGVQ